MVPCWRIFNFCWIISLCNKMSSWFFPSVETNSNMALKYWIKLRVKCICVDLGYIFSSVSTPFHLKNPLGAALLTWFLLRDRCSSMSSSLSTSPLLLEAVSQPPRSRDQGKPWRQGQRQLCGLGRCHTMFSSENREEALRRRGGEPPGWQIEGGEQRVWMPARAPARSWWAVRLLQTNVTVNWGGSWFCSNSKTFTFCRERRREEVFKEKDTEEVFTGGNGARKVPMTIFRILLVFSLCMFTYSLMICNYECLKKNIWKKNVFQTYSFNL